MARAVAIERARAQLRASADADRAAAMAAYMKTDQPFYGVRKPERVPILRTLVAELAPADRADYEATVLALWNLDHREEQYLALGYARSFPVFVDGEAIPLYRRLIVEGRWWDLVDEAATKLVGAALAGDRPTVTPVVRSWIGDTDTWLRRTAIICQLGHGASTDVDLLEEACTENLADTDFFIRKAIGWALREYARTDPDRVRAYVAAHRGRMAGLSVREATKHLG